LKATFIAIRNKITQKHHDISNVIAISGVYRGGTTFLSEVIMDADNFALLWEPLHFGALKKYRKGFDKDLGFLPYIPKGITWDEATEYFNQVFRGEFLSREMIDHRSKINLQGNRILVKFCRANMLLPWLSDNFNVNVIFIVRHPCAVVSSQLNHPNFNRVFDEVDIFSLQESKHMDIFNELKHIRKNVKSKIEMLSHQWALQNLVPLADQYNNDKWITLSYENLLLNPVEEAARLQKFTGLEIKNSLMDHLKIPSSSTQGKMARMDRKTQIRVWKDRLSNEEIRQILNIVDSYGIKGFDESEVPDLSFIYGNNEASNYLS